MTNKFEWLIYIPQNFNFQKNTVLNNPTWVAKYQGLEDEDLSGDWVFRGVFDKEYALPKNKIADKEYIIYKCISVACNHGITAFAVMDDEYFLGWFQREIVTPEEPLGFMIAAAIIDMPPDEDDVETPVSDSSVTPGLSDFFKASYDKYYSQPKKAKTKGN
ncbi:hypothetical protein [Nostoc sp.]|uniref:hypothetical protein n=1 Tax=Nostoc sp. TaxID=1180 RepID=UPI002FF627C4